MTQLLSSWPLASEPGDCLQTCPDPSKSFHMLALCLHGRVPILYAANAKRATTGKVSRGGPGCANVMQQIFGPSWR